MHVRLALLLVLGCGGAAKPPSNAATPTAADPHDRVFAALRVDGVNTSCVMLDDEDDGVIAVREKHDGGCPGDPQTSPVVRRYRVVADKLQRYDVANDAWQ